MKDLQELSRLSDTLRFLILTDLARDWGVITNGTVCICERGLAEEFRDGKGVVFQEISRMSDTLRHFNLDDLGRDWSLLSQQTPASV